MSFLENQLRFIESVCCLLNPHVIIFCHNYYFSYPLHWALTDSQFSETLWVHCYIIYLKSLWIFEESIWAYGCKGLEPVIERKHGRRNKNLTAPTLKHKHKAEKVNVNISCMWYVTFSHTFPPTMLYILILLKQVH